MAVILDFILSLDTIKSSIIYEDNFICILMYARTKIVFNIFGQMIEHVR